jgi:hypothetical protein
VQLYGVFWSAFRANAAEWTVNPVMSWLMRGAGFGFLVVIVGHEALSLPIENWLAVIITTVSAVIFAWATPVDSGAPRSPGGP